MTGRDALELGVARSTAWLWVKHLPLDRNSERARLKRAKGKQLTDGRWAAHRVAREQRKAALVAAGAAEVGDLTDREILLLGAAIYWCEGAKTKPWRPDDARVLLTSSDLDLIALFLRFLAGVGICREDLKYRVAIHDSADPMAAMQWWADGLRLPLERFYPPSLKRHRPATTRRNIGVDYHGCLVITVPRGRELYWRIEGMMAGIASAAGSHSASGSKRR